MVNSVYGFVNSFGTAPVTFVNIDEKDHVSEIFKIKKFKTETKKKLLTEVINIAAEPEENYAVGKIKLTTSGNTTKKKIQEIYTKSNTTLSYSPDVIVHNGTSFILNFPLRCSLEKEDGYYIIQSEMLDLVGTGETEDDAEANLAEEFSYIYKRYNEIDSSNLSTRILQIKDILNYLVNRVED
jgi:glutamine phosphoribosylpyrophosphate amidotransferase